MFTLDRCRMKYVWFWLKKLGDRKNQPCKMLARGKKNSVLIEFEDGFRVITSRNAVRLNKNNLTKKG